MPETLIILPTYNEAQSLPRPPKNSQRSLRPWRPTNGCGPVAAAMARISPSRAWPNTSRTTLCITGGTSPDSASADYDVR